MVTVMNALKQEPRTHLLEVVGRLDGRNADRLFSQCENALDAGYANQILELSQVEYINSAGLRLLVKMFNHVGEKGGILRLANPSDRVQRVMLLVGLDSVLEIIDDATLPAATPDPERYPNLRRQVCYCV